MIVNINQVMNILFLFCLLAVLIFEISFNPDRHIQIHFQKLSGYYCPQGTANYTDFPCPTGYYCQASTQNWNQYPCTAGTFNNLTMRTSSIDCISCTGKGE